MSEMMEKAQAYEAEEAYVAPSSDSAKRMMVAGALGLAAVCLVAAAPELGVGGVIGGAIAGSGSAIATLFARR